MRHDPSSAEDGGAGQAESSVAVDSDARRIVLSQNWACARPGFNMIACRIEAAAHEGAFR